MAALGQKNQRHRTIIFARFGMPDATPMRSGPRWRQPPPGGRIGKAVGGAVVACFSPVAAIVIVTPVEVEQQFVEGLFVE